MDKFELGNTKQIIVSIILCAIAVIAIKSPHVANIHLAITSLMGIIHIYLCHHWNKGQIKKQSEAPASYAYTFTYGFNAILSIAFSWWLSGIVWIYCLCIYIAVQTPKKVKAEEKTAK